MSRNSKESQFEAWELFFSRTRRNGVILSGNSVFARVSKFRIEDMINKAHSLVRHSDMPRVVFKYMWDEILAGKPLTAYVKNKASDGSYYWVLATVFEIENEFISIRLKPTTNTLNSIVEPLYKKLKELESTHDFEGQTKVLLEELKKAGFDDYSQFMHSALKTELAQLVEPLQKRFQTEGSLNEILVWLSKSQLSMIQGFDKTSQTVGLLQAEFEELKKLSQAQELLPFNLTLSTQKSKTTQKTMEVLSGLFAQQQKDVGLFLKSFQTIISEAEKNGLSPLRYDIGGGFLQVAMISQFLEEAQKSNSQENFEECVTLLKSASKQIEKTLSGVNDLRSRFIQILSEREEMSTLVKSVLSIAQLGQVEISQDESIKSSALPHLNEMRKMAEHLNEKISNIGVELKGAADNLSFVSRSLIQQNKKCVQAQLQLQKTNRVAKAA